VSSSLGLESGVVRLVACDPTWPALFQAEAARIATGVSPTGIRIEHVGSTAVPGLPAKPVLDILAGYHAPEDRDLLIASLQHTGYLYRGEQGIPGRDFFRRGEPRAYHVHLTVVGSPFWQDHLDFRDLLRTDPATRDAYAALKHELAARYPRDREAYIAGKGPFVRDALSRWRQGHRA